MPNSHETNHPAGSAPRRRRRRRSPWGTVGRVIGTLALIGLTTGAFLACFAAVYIQTVIMPQTGLTLSDYTLDLTTTMYYTDPDTQEKMELRTFHGDENRVWVSYSEIPEDLVNAAIAIEDKRFYSHHGVDWLRTLNGVLLMFTGKDIQGGSTITQQLIKNITTYNDVTVKRKIIEIFRALEFDKNYSKQTTLEWYLNYIPLGAGCSGVYTASYTYFGKHVSELSLAECASLIGITNNPSRYGPYSTAKFTDSETGEELTARDMNKRRQETILWQMYEQGMISAEERDAAIAEELNFVRGEGETQEVEPYTWYEDQVISDVVNDLMAELDLSREAALDMFYSGGLEIDTCLNPKVQAAVDAVYEDQSNLDHVSNTGQQLQSGITVVDNATGNVVALAGGIGEKTGSRIHSRATDTVRPPGSSIKPLAVYAPALEMGLITPGTVIDDTPYSVEDGSAWPVNSYGYYRGRMTVYDALEVSSNPVAVKVCCDYITPQIAFDFMTQKLGFTSLVQAAEINGRTYTDVAPGAMALGGLTNGVSTYEMAAAYSAFARGGVYITPRTYTQVRDSEGNVLLDNTQTSTAVMKETTAWYINYMLENVVSSGTGTRAKFSGMTIAGKTGTTTSRRDLWFVGYTPYYTAAVWTGYDQQERLASSLGNPSTTLWKQVMSVVHEGLENRDFPTPSGAEIVTVRYCADSGMLATDYCKTDIRGNREISGSFIKGEEPTQFCTLHVPAEICTDSPILDANGEETGLYHLAGEYCPREGTEGTEASVQTIGVLDYNRIRVTDSVVARDDQYLKSYLDAAGTCTVHTQAVVTPTPPPDFDINDPATWPTDDPFFNPFDPTTWPGYEPSDPSTDNPEPTPSPTTTPPPAEPTATLPPEPTEGVEGPDEEPYIPAA